MSSKLEINHVVNAMTSLASAFEMLAHSPATPELTKEIYVGAGQQMRIAAGNIVCERQNEILEGIGDASLTLLSIGRWIKGASVTSPELVPVLRKFTYDENVLCGKELERLTRELGSLFRMLFPVELFMLGDELISRSIGHSFAGCLFRITVSIAKPATDQEFAYLDSIHISYSPREEYWLANATLTNRHVLFKEAMGAVHLSGINHIEGEPFATSSPSFCNFIDSDILDKVCELLSVQRSALRDDEPLEFAIENFNPLAILEEEVAKRELPNEAVMNQAMEYLFRKARNEVSAGVKEHDIHFVLKTDNSSWHSYDNYLEKKDDYFVTYYGQTWFSLQKLEVYGMVIDKHRKLPKYIFDSINDEIRQVVSNILSTMFEEWNERPYGAWKEYVESVSEEADS